jgi:hypothetical protein
MEPTSMLTPNGDNISSKARSNNSKSDQIDTESYDNSSSNAHTFRDTEIEE